MGLMAWGGVGGVGLVGRVLRVGLVGGGEVRIGHKN